MAQARRTNATISLFSFQDIITGVTAIVLLLTLLLLLELISRKATASLKASSTTTAELIELTEIMAANPPPTSDVFNGVPSAAAVRQLIDRYTRAARRERESLTDRLQEVRERSKETLATLQQVQTAHAAEAARVDDVAALQREADRFRRQLEDRQQKITDLKRQLAAAEARAEMPAGPPTLQFRAADRAEQGSWLVVLAAAKVVAMPVGGGERETWSGSLASEQFAAWLAGSRSSPQPRHCVVLIRPSGISLYEPVRAAIEAAGISIGTEAIGEKQQVSVPTSEGGPA